MLWTLLQLMSSVNLLVGAFVPFDSRAGFSVANCAIALGVGLVLAAGNLLGLNRLGDFVDQRLMRHPQSVRESRLRLLYLAAGLWVILSVFVGSSIVERLVA